MSASPWLVSRHTLQISLPRLLKVEDAALVGDNDVLQAVAVHVVDFEGGAKSPVERLSDREFEVFVRLAGGATVQRIAGDLNLSASTIGTHLYNIKQKLGVANQSELTLIAIRHGLIET